MRRTAGHGGARLLWPALLALVVAILPGTLRSEDARIEAFFGTFEGRTLFPMGEEANRQLKVIIHPYDHGGFTLAWETAIFKSGRGPVRKAETFSFQPTMRPGVYGVVRPEAGEEGELALIDGESYAWAQLVDKTLSVHVFTIMENGDYVVQTYHRRLAQGGMTLDFTRVRNGTMERQIKGTYRRVHE